MYTFLRDFPEAKIWSRDVILVCVDFHCARDRIAVSRAILKLVKTDVAIPGRLRPRVGEFFDAPSNTIGNQEKVSMARTPKKKRAVIRRLIFLQRLMGCGY